MSLDEADLPTMLIATPAASSPEGGSGFFWKGRSQKKEVRRCGIGKLKTLGQELSEVKASGEDDKTRRPRGLLAASAKEERPVARPETPPTAQSA